MRHRSQQPSSDPHLMVIPPCSLGFWYQLCHWKRAKRHKRWRKDNPHPPSLYFYVFVSPSPKVGPWEQVKWREDRFLFSPHHSWILISAEGQQPRNNKQQLPTPLSAVMHLCFKLNMRSKSAFPRAWGFHSLGRDPLQCGFWISTVWSVPRSEFGSRQDM